jgi:hypothetical protein
MTSVQIPSQLSMTLSVGHCLIWRPKTDWWCLCGVLGIRLSSFVPTRIFELAVHSLDIARATGVPLLMPAEAIGAATMLAARIAVESGHGTDILLALTGRGALAPGFSAL